MRRETAAEVDCARALWLLGLEPPVSAQQLAAAWRERVSRTHPDRHLESRSKSEAATLLTAALNDARALVAAWIADGHPWPAPLRAVAPEEDDAPTPRQPARAQGPPPIDRRTGLRRGDRVRLWPYDGEVVTVTDVEQDDDGQPWVALAEGGAARASRVRLAEFGCPVCGLCAGPAVDRPAIRPCPDCLIDLRRLDLRPTEATRVRSAIEARAQAGRVTAVALGDASLAERAESRLRWARRLRDASDEDLHAALLAAFGRAFERWSGIAA
jgi:hypothetical protein